MSSSKNNTLTYVFLILAFLAVACVIGYLAGNKGPDKDGATPPSPISDGGPVIIDETGDTTAVDKSQIENQECIVKETKHTCKSIDRIQSRKTIGDFKITGTGHNANWGIKEKTTFNYHFMIDSDSKIVYKERKPSGTIKILEERTFNVVLDEITTGDTELGVLIDESALDTLKWAEEQIANGADFVIPGLGSVIRSGGEVIDKTLRPLNGSTIKSPIPAFQKLFDWIAQNHTKKVLGLAALHDISGKTFKVSWYQQKDGTPMYMSVVNGDGSKISEKEQLLLKRFNIFLDYDVVPHRELKVGESWSINAENLSELYDPYIEGNISGDIAVTLQEKDENNKWTLEMKTPCDIKVISNNGETTGHIKINSGYAKVKPDDITVDEMNSKGKVDIKHLSRHHFLFKTDVEGLCEFEGKLYSKPIDDSDAPEGNQESASPENNEESNN